jgi:hypothetical protein
MSTAFEERIQMDDCEKKYRLDPGNIEERTAVRFPLALPVHVMTPSRLYEGVTENISSNGVLLRLNEVPESGLEPDLGPGAQLDFLIQVEKGLTGPDETAAIHCQGRIVRSYQEGTTAHAAAIIDEYRFQTDEDSAETA